MLSVLFYVVSPFIMHVALEVISELEEGRWRFSLGPSPSPFSQTDRPAEDLECLRAGLTCVTVRCFLADWMRTKAVFGELTYG